MAMYDINGEEFQVGDTLKVIKEGYPLSVGDVLVCAYDDDSTRCRFSMVGEDPKGIGWWVHNDRLQKV